MYCKHCGKKISKDSKFCKECGSGLVVNQEETNKPEETEVIEEQAEVVEDIKKPDPEYYDSSSGSSLNGVKGWLAFLVFLLIAWYPAYQGYNLLVDLNDTTIQDMTYEYSGLDTVIMFENIYLVIAIIFSFYVGYLLLNKKDNAVRIAKYYFIFVITITVVDAFWALSVFSSIVEMPSDFEIKAYTAMFGTVFWSGIWIVYLSKSQRVKLTYKEGQ